MSRRVLFVSNGHGEIAIAARIAAEAHSRGVELQDHLALVGDGGAQTDALGQVGPRRRMPSGGLVAMGNVSAFARDVAAGFVSLWLAQRRFLLASRGVYAVVVAVGDVYCLGMALAARAPAIFVGTAKSAYVAPYGPFERTVLRRARRVYVRDDVTARSLRSRGVAAEFAGNVIADLAQASERFAWSGPVRIAVLPGSRAAAYANAARLGAVLSRVAAVREIEIAVSVAPGIDAARLGTALGIPARPWAGEVGALFSGATLAFGQAGTANEAAAAAGVPVVALADARKEDWYRMRQRRLLDGALAIVPDDPARAADAILALLDDAARRDDMSRIGRERMGAGGAASSIAATIVEMAGCAADR